MAQEVLPVQDPRGELAMEAKLNGEVRRLTVADEEQQQQLQSKQKQTSAFKLARDDDAHSQDQRRPRSSDSGVASPVGGSNSGASVGTAASETVNLLSAAAADLHISDSDATANGVADDGLAKSPEPGLGSEGGEAYVAETALSDSGQGSEPDDSIVMAYHFMMPGLLCGKLIGAGGQTVKYLKQTSGCYIHLKSKRENGRRPSNNDTAPQVCVIEGTRTAIEKCLGLIRERFPVDQFPDLTLEQTNVGLSYEELKALSSSDPQLGSTDPREALVPGDTPQQVLAQGGVEIVFVSAIVSAGHVFVQQPQHPTFAFLPRLSECMKKTYSFLQTPALDRAILAPGVVCAAPCDDMWYRVQVVSFDPASDVCQVKYLDYGGFEAVQASALRQIRADFLSLPFQAIECFLSNIVPCDGNEWSLQAAIDLEELIRNKFCSGQMVGFTDDYQPLFMLYAASKADGEDAALVNRQLVDRKVAAWVEAAAADV